MALYVGTAGWSYPSGKGKWDGVFYPPRLSSAQKLQYYADRFNVVEINSSFYRPPSPTDTYEWAKRTPPGFRFTAKLYQKFTHPRLYEEKRGEGAARLQPEDFETFQAGLEPLAEAGKLGILVAQFPPSFKASEASLEYLDDLLRRFARFPVAVELRHRGWTNHAQGRRLFEERGVAWVMIDEPRFRTSIRHVPITSRVAYFRFHGRNYKQWWTHESAEDRYNHLYSPEEQSELSEEVRAAAGQTDDTYAIYNNHYGAKAVVNAVQLRADLGLPVHEDWHPELLARYPQILPSIRPEP